MCAALPIFFPGRYIVFCGLGNNGGDGLAISRLLLETENDVEIFIVRHSDKCSEDFIVNERRLKKNYTKKIHDIRSKKDFPELRWRI